MRVLVSWIGGNDLRCSRGEQPGVGPIARAFEAREFDEAWLLSNYPKRESRAYVKWLGTRTSTKLHFRPESLPSPTAHAAIYSVADTALEEIRALYDESLDLWIHLSPGTPAMHAVWLLLAKTRHPATLIQSSREAGVEEADAPFEISLDYIPALYRRGDAALGELSAGPEPSPAFDKIVHRSAEMRRVVQRAQRVAPRSVPVLIEGESGTGKELFAGAIHDASPRRSHDLVVVNCGAIPAELFESQLFGHVKGAFTGADRTQPGFFEAADGGTLFLDELGELPLAAQVKMLRVLQEGEVTRVGETRIRKVDVRIIAATNRNLAAEVAEGRFREDLFYRVALAVINLPPLRDRRGDIGLLITRLLEVANDRLASTDPGFQRKNLSADARNLLLRHRWPGNVRELLNTLTRAAIWSDGSTIDVREAGDALLAVPPRGGDVVVGRSLPVDLKAITAGVSLHYLDRALEEAGGVKQRAAELVGASSANTFTSWRRIAVRDGGTGGT